MNVLVLNCFSRNSLAVLGSLNDHYFIVGASNPAKFQFLDRFFRHKRIQKVFRYTNPKESKERFKNDVLKIISEHGIDIVVATGTETTDALSYYKKEIEGASRVKLLVDEFERLHVLTDKWQLAELCKQIGVTVPKSVLFDDLNTLPEVVKENGIEIPFIIKPIRSHSSKGLQIFRTANSYDQFLKDISNQKNFGEYIIQEYIEGETHDACFLAQKGSLVYGLSQCRKMVWANTGGGIINLTTDFPEIIDIARKIVVHVGFTGIGMFEFIRRQSDGKFFLIECNPKVWGTTDLTIQSGLNIIQDAIDIIIGGKDIDSYQDKTYEKNLLYKWTFPECFSSLLMTTPHSLSTMKNQYRQINNNYGACRIIKNTKLNSRRSLIAEIINKA